MMQKNTTCLLILEAISDVSPFLPGKFPHYIFENKPIIHLGPKQSETRRLLGSDYSFSCEANDVKGIEKIITTLYKQWELKNELQLNRPDLEAYCSSDYFKQCLQTTLA
jgi:hypothetical protein